MIHFYGFSTTGDTQYEALQTTLKDILGDLKNADIVIYLKDGKVLGTAVIPVKPTDGTLGVPAPEAFEAGNFKWNNKKAGIYSETQGHIVGTSPDLKFDASGNDDRSTVGASL